MEIGEGKKDNLKVNEEEIKIMNEVTAKEQSKIVKYILIWVAVLVAIFIFILWAIGSVNKFDYRGVEFKTVKEGNLLFYNVVYPLQSSITGKHIADYNFFIRNNPNDLEDVPFYGKIVFTQLMVINSSDSFNCDGQGIIAIANFVKMYDAFGIKVMKDENATCDPEGKYTFIQLDKANETSIEQFGPTCYQVNIANCEILKAMEKFMVETIVRTFEMKKE
jgi:hypothetical protein